MFSTKTNKRTFYFTFYNAKLKFGFCFLKLQPKKNAVIYPLCSFNFCHKVEFQKIALIFKLQNNLIPINVSLKFKHRKVFNPFFCIAHRSWVYLHFFAFWNDDFFCTVLFLVIFEENLKNLSNLKNWKNLMINSKILNLTLKTFSLGTYTENYKKKFTSIFHFYSFH